MAAQPQTILITGASGYIGFETLCQALEAGHTVIAPVRSASKASSITSHPDITAHASRLTVPIVSDLRSSGPLASLLSQHGATSLIHLASPLGLATDDLEGDIVAPATQMLSAALEAAAACPAVTRVAVTSSLVTLVPFQWNAAPDVARVYTAADVNRDPLRPFTSSMEAYWGSKALARTDSHAFMADRRPAFRLVNLLPGVVTGPDRGSDSEEALRQAARELTLAPVLGIDNPGPLVNVPVDVRDVAAAHVRAVELDDLPVNELGYLDLALSQPGPDDNVQWDEVLEIARRRFPDHCGEGKALPLGGSLGTQTWRVDAKVSEELLGLRFRTFEQTMGDLVAQLVDIRTKER